MNTYSLFITKPTIIKEMAFQPSLDGKVTVTLHVLFQPNGARSERSSSEVVSLERARTLYKDWLERGATKTLGA